MDVIVNKPGNGLPHVWLVGDASYPEFRDAVAELRQTAHVTQVASPREAANGHSNLPSPDVLVLAHARPGMVSQDGMNAIRQRHAHSQIFSLMASWCESESPSRLPAERNEHVMWHEFVSWWRTRFLMMPRLQQVGRGLIVIDSAWRESADALSDALAAEGYATLWLPRGRRMPLFGGAALGIWDGGQFDPSERLPLLDFRRRLDQDGAPLVALLDFPRHDRRDLMMELGAAALLGKPVSLDCLIQTVDELSLPQPRRAASVVPKAA